MEIKFTKDQSKRIANALADYLACHIEDGYVDENIFEDIVSSARDKFLKHLTKIAEEEMEKIIMDDDAIRKKIRQRILEKL